MISCNLNKPESTFDQIRKEYSKLKPTEAALIATALVEAGRFADVEHDGVSHAWTPDNYESGSASIGREVSQINETIAQEEAGKKKTKAEREAEQEAVTLHVQFIPSVEAGEAILGGDKNLIKMFRGILEEGVEYLYTPTDIGWHWTLDRVNWATQSSGSLERNIAFKAQFAEPHVSIELGPGGKKKGAKKVKSKK